MKNLRLSTAVPSRAPRAFRTLHVPSAADGPTYVLLHGIGLSHRSFSGLARQLSRSGPVVSFDLPGFGASPHPGRPLSVEDYATVIRRELERLDLGPVVVVGHSMGAQFAVELARQAPDAVSRVVLVGPVTDATRRTLLAQARALARDSALEPPATQLMVIFDYLRCGVRWFFTEVGAMLGYPTHLALADVAQPVLVIRGEHDPIAKAEWCAALSSVAPDGRVATIPGHRHNVVHSNPVDTAAVIVAFAT